MSDSGPGRHFLQIPGPTNLPERVKRALSRPTIDHRGPDCARMTLSILERLKEVFQTDGPVIIYPSSGSGAWEAALVNTLCPGDRVLFGSNGQFSSTWQNVAAGVGMTVEELQGDWRCPIDLAALENRLAEDRGREIRALALVHNETSTGVVNDVAGARAALDRTGHDALLLVDVISSLGAIDYRHDEWGVDVTIAGSQKGLMIPPGLGFNAPSQKALEASDSAGQPRSYWDWGRILEFNRDGFYPYTPATNLLFALDEALSMLLEEGLANVFARHARLAEATRRAVRGWGLDIYCRDPKAYSNALTAVSMPAGFNADLLRQVILERFDMSLGTGLGQLKGKAFRIGHLGDLNELTLAGTLCGVEMGLAACDVPHLSGGVKEALAFLAKDP
ncbi:MAG: aminotransferase class V-fold PLP-dependent enzyme [Caldilineaceae bacterium SB0668_bin_21]|nr:aminotransferase class V-fold PLP-dependent enzyme [Caldilineaceae bacterium SB0668_bin_21]MYC24035.1 aminotransferase class V-fold PLP-dependent enzyme [Caldilineaceae bacterium SB0662_bin_25]